MTVFEFQVDPDRNAIIRRALAKRIVRQREVDDEEASTEEDESFLENSPKIVATGAAARKGTPTDLFATPTLPHPTLSNVFFFRCSFFNGTAFFNFFFVWHILLNEPWVKAEREANKHSGKRKDVDACSSMTDLIKFDMKKNTANK